MISIGDFLPKYDFIHNRNFYESVLQKKEFYDLKLLPREEIVEIIDNEEEEEEEEDEDYTFDEDEDNETKEIKNYEFLNHQKIVSRFLSSYTPYDQILLIHEMGTGKTASAIAIIERVKSEKSNFKKAYILTGNEDLYENFKEDIVFKFTQGRYVPENYKYLTKREKTVRINKLLSDFYEFDTIEKFSKMITKMGNRQIVDTYSNSIFVIDEIHNISPQKSKRDASKLDIYKNLFKLLHTAQNTKIILMSGTPMEDNIVEIADVMNLILPLDKQLPTNKNFLKAFFTKKDTIFTITDEKKDELKQYFKGRVSYIKTIQSDIKKVFIGETVGKLKFLKVYEDFMSDFQTNIYAQTFRKEKDLETKLDKVIDEDDIDDDSKKNSIYTDSRFASLCVFPDGSFGSQGFENNIKVIVRENDIPLYDKSTNLPIIDPNTGEIKRKKVKTTKFAFYSESEQSPNIVKEIKDRDQNVMLEKLSKYSSKYATTIRSILEAKKQGKLSFVFIKFVNGTGSILFSLLLNLFGFKESKGNDNTPGLRYALLNSEYTSKLESKRIKKLFNSPKNKHGDYIAVLIGSTVISEGFTLMNVQEEHIITPHWNYSETDQVIARGYRLGSHKDLIEEGIIPEVNVYQHVSIPSSPDIESIDLKLFETSEAKDINIKHVERILQESAVDCALNYYRNYKQGYDYQRECNYSSCEYVCDGIQSLVVPPKKIDKNTYNLYYNIDKVQEIINKLVLIFRANFILSFRSIVNMITSDDNECSEFDILTALSEIINTNILIKNKYGVVSFLREENRNFYLVDDITLKNNIYSEFYSTNQIVQKETNYDNIINEEFEKSTTNIIDTIFRVDDDDEEVVSFLINTLPPKLQNFLLEASITSIENNNETNSAKRDLIFKILKKYAMKIDDDKVWVSALLYEEENILKCSYIEDKFTKWNICSNENENLFNKRKEEELTTLETNIYNFYGIITEEGKFQIKDTSEIENTGRYNTNKQKKGMVCTSYSKPQLYDFIFKVFKINITPDKNSKEWKSVKDGDGDKDTLKKNKYSENFYIENIESLNEEEVKFYLYMLKLGKGELCSIIQKFLKEKGLLREKI